MIRNKKIEVFINTNGPWPKLRAVLDKDFLFQGESV